MKAVISAAMMATLAVLPAASALAQGASPAAPGNDPYMQAAIDSGVCGDARVLTAVFVQDRNVIEVTCEEEAAGFFPLAGGLGPALAAGGAALALVAMSSSSDTQ